MKPHIVPWSPVNISSGSELSLLFIKSWMKISGTTNDGSLPPSMHTIMQVVIIFESICFQFLYLFNPGSDSMTRTSPRRATLPWHTRHVLWLLFTLPYLTADVEGKIAASLRSLLNTNSFEVRVVGYESKVGLFLAAILAHSAHNWDDNHYGSYPVTLVNIHSVQ